MLPVDGHMVTTAICYEVVYPHLIRDGVRQGSELLTTITNDAWYGESSAAFQHFELATHARHRAGPLPGARREHRHQRHRRSLRPRRSRGRQLFETTTVVGEVRFLQERTVYATIGDLPAQLAVVLTIVGLGVSMWRRPSTRRT